MNGSGNGRGLPSTLTWRSSIASSSAACVLGGVRLISSASSRLVNTGPEWNSNSAVRASYTKRAGDIAGHQVGGELHTLEFELQRRRQCPHQQRLRDAGNALEQHVASAQQRDHQAADDCVLPDDGLADLGTQGQQRISCGFSAGGAAPWCAVESRCSDLPFDVVECVSKVYQVGVGGRRWAEQYVPHRLSGSVRSARRRPGRPRPASASCPRPSRRQSVGAASRRRSASRRDRVLAATGTAVRGPRRSPMRGPPQAACSATSGPTRRPFHTAISSTTRHSCRTIQLPDQGTNRQSMWTLD